MKLPEPKPADTLPRTDWLDPEIGPDAPGHYECTLGPGSDYVFKRRYDGENWRSPVTDVVSRVRLKWRGVVPGSIDINQYPRQDREVLLQILNLSKEPT